MAVARGALAIKIFQNHDSKGLGWTFEVPGSGLGDVWDLRFRARGWGFAFGFQVLGLQDSGFLEPRFGLVGCHQHSQMY